MTKRSAERPALREIRELVRSRDWPAVAERLRDVPTEHLVDEPELGLHYADACHRIGRPAVARAVAESIERRAFELGDRHLFLALVNVIGIAHFGLGEMDEAEARFSALLAFSTAWGDEEFSARAANNLGIIENIRGRTNAALTFFQRALAAYARVGAVRGLAQTHHNLGIACRDLGRLDRADGHLRQALDLAATEGSEDVVALVEAEMGNLRLEAGDARLAESFARRALERFERLGDPLGRAEAMRVLALTADALARPDEALRLLDQALSVATSHSEPLLRAEVQRERGRILAARADTRAAADALRDAAAHFEEIGAAADAAVVRTLAERLEAELST